MTRACSLQKEGSRLAPHQEGWALEALKYAGSYVPPTSLALFSRRRSELRQRKVSPNDPFSRAFRRRSPPRQERPLASKGGVEAKRALSGAIRLPVRPTRSLQCPEGHLALEPALRSPPKEISPRLPISSEDDTFTKLATSLTTDHSPKTAACPVRTRPTTQHEAGACLITHWRGETHRTGDERARRQDRLTVSFHALKDASRGVHVSRPGQRSNPRRDSRAAATALEGSDPFP